MTKRKNFPGKANQRRVRTLEYLKHRLSSGHNRNWCAIDITQTIKRDITALEEKIVAHDVAVGIKTKKRRA